MYYHYHLLFQEYLKKELGEKRIPLLKRAANISYEQGEKEMAIEYYLEAGRREEAIHVIREMGLEIFYYGHWRTLEK